MKAKTGLQRVPLIGRKFAKNEAGVYVPPKENVTVKKVEPTPKAKPVARAVSRDLGEAPQTKARAKRRVTNKQSKKSRKKNRGTKKH